MPSCGTDKSLPSVPRSKGCLTCVARKTRCDGRRPKCKACEDRKQACQGYRRQAFVFLSDGWRAPGVATGKRKNSAPARGKTPKLQGSGSRDTLSPDTAAGLVLCRGPAVDRSQLYIPFFLSEFEEKFTGPKFFVPLFQYYFSFQPSGVSTDSGCGQTAITPAAFAVDALAQGHFGMTNTDQISIQQSFRHYGMALRAMSAQLGGILNPNSELPCLSEEQWQHFVFFCLVMAFWELKMLPASRNWQMHVRGLANAIVLRGAGHKYSEINQGLLATSRLFIILQQVSSRQASFLLGPGWQPTRDAWLAEVKAREAQQKWPIFCSDGEFYASVDILITKIAAMAAVMARYDQMLKDVEAARRSGQGWVDVGRALLILHNAAETILHQTQVLWAGIGSSMTEIPITKWLACHKEVAGGPSCTDQSRLHVDWHIESFFDSVLSFFSMKEYHITTLYWTTVISLRLLLSDILALIIEISPHGMPANPSRDVEQHRYHLMDSAQKVLRAIPFASLKENAATVPFFLVSGIQMTIETLDRERETLASRGENETLIIRCRGLRDLAASYLDWAMRNKIPIRVDIKPHQQ
ncbi:hypothetical protein GQ53DRAFT_840960 [Thozetella sp. PMI_491]|nr:hypothetical protein GQ53DRAFT_840960 [Thozetella sp. PMI_491]